MQFANLLRRAVVKKDPADYEIWERALMAAGDKNVTGLIRNILNQQLSVLIDKLLVIS